MKIVIKEGLHSDDFIKGKLTIHISAEFRGVSNTILFFKVNESLWKNNEIYRRRVWRVINPIPTIVYALKEFNEYISR